MHDLSCLISAIDASNVELTVLLSKVSKKFLDLLWTVPRAKSSDDMFSILVKMTVKVNSCLVLVLNMKLTKVLFLQL